MKSRRIGWAGHVARMEAVRDSYKILVGTCGGKRLVGRPRSGCETNIGIDITEI
jgi:hypothetical protein